MKKAYKICYDVFSILGALLGAGFISGAEVVTFFGRFGYYGIIGIVISSIIFGVVIIKSQNNNDEKNKYNFLPFCQLAIAGSMFAGVVRVISDITQINSYLVCFLVLILLIISLIIGIKFANIFNVLVTVSTIIILPFVYQNIDINYNIYPVSSLFLMPLFAILYAIMNSVACMQVIKSIDKKSSKVVAILCIIITIILLIIMLILSSNNTNEMPILSLIKSGKIKAIYTIIFMLAMVSTMFSASSGTKQIFHKIDNNIVCSLCSAMAICSISFMGFGAIINYLYPLIGIVMILQIFLNKVHKNAEKTQKNTKLIKNNAKF